MLLTRWGWVLGLSVDQLVAWGTLYYAYAVVGPPMAAELGLSRELVAAGFSIALLSSGLLARAVGRALDREGARRVLLAGAVVSPLALAALAGGRGVVTLLLAFLAVGIAQALGLYEAAFRAVVDGFPRPHERSRALLLLTSVAGFASTLFLPVTAALVTRLGWRGAVLVLAALVAAVTLPVRLALPSRDGERPAAPAEPVEPSAATALLGAAFALQTFAATGAMIGLVWLLVEKGETVGSAALLAGLAGASQVPGRLLLAPLQRALRTERRLPLLFVVQSIALAALSFGEGVATIPAIFVFGAAGGTMTLERAAVVLEWFDRERFGTHSGRIASIAFPARAAAPFVVEWLHGVASYARGFAVLAVVLAAGAIAVVLASRSVRRGRRPAPATRG